MSINCYARVQDTSEDPRATEYRALGFVTGKLIEAKEKGGRALIEALYANQNLWTLFQADLAHPGNALPQEVRAQLLSLSLWVQRFTSKVMRDEANIEALIDVNKAIMDGLKPQAASHPVAEREAAMHQYGPISASV